MAESSSDLRSSGERRSTQERFRVVERRGGFDRRGPGGVLVILRDEPFILLGLLILLNLLSAADWALTMHAMQYGALEANPLLNALISTNPTQAAIFKAVVILGISVAVWAGRRYRLLLATAVGAVAVYALLMLYHFGGIAIGGGL